MSKQVMIDDAELAVLREQAGQRDVAVEMLVEHGLLGLACPAALDLRPERSMQVRVWHVLGRWLEAVAQGKTDVEHSITIRATTMGRERDKNGLRADMGIRIEHAEVDRMDGWAVLPKTDKENG